MDKPPLDIRQGSRSGTGIPRLSRLPAPRVSINASHNGREASSFGLNAALGLKPTISSQATPTSSKRSFQCGGRPVKTRDTLDVQSASTRSVSEDDQVSAAKLRVSIQEDSYNLPDTTESDTNGGAGPDTNLMQDLPVKRRPRPSLSDRTIQTLSQIPYSPSPTKRRSSFFTTDSPVRNAPRPESAMSSLRSTVGPARPSSPSKRAAIPPVASLKIARESLQTGSALDRHQNRSVPRGATSATPSTKLGSATVRTPSKISATTTVRTKAGEAAHGIRYPARKIGSKTISTSPTRKTPSLVSVFQPPSQDEMDNPASNIGRLRLGSGRNAGQSRDASNQSASTVSSTIPSRSSTSSRMSVRSPKSPFTDVDQSDIRSSPGVKSSSVLRATIVKAKAEAAKKKRTSDQPQRVSEDDPAFDDISDPFNQSPGGGTSKGLLRKRVEAGRTTGILNIAAMDLAEMPDEVMEMYEFNSDAVGSSWAESVDLVKFIGADNKLELLREDGFPDVDTGNASEEHNLQFRGLEVLDLHGNILKSLPLGLAMLDRLTVLNLSHNHLEMSCLRVICSLEHLKELNLAHNRLTGPLSIRIGMLSSLRSLYLQDNEITELGGLESLEELKLLHLSLNRLKSLPFECLSSLPLIELKASKNFLFGPLIPSTVSSFPTLQSLTVSCNALTSISEFESFSFPALRTLDVSGNRMSRLPDISPWTNLQALDASENSLSSIPQGFTSLEGISNANFSSNNISRLDEKMALMKNLTNLNVQGNPLRDRKFFTMGWEGIKKELLKRLEMGLTNESQSTSTGSVKMRGGAADDADESKQDARDKAPATAPPPRGAAIAARTSRKPEPQMPSWLYGD